MKITILRISIIIQFTAALLLFIPAQAEQKKESKVLVLNSYHYGYQWTDDIVKGIQSVLNKNVELRIDYMDARRIWDTQYINKLHDILHHKFRTLRFDVIIASDNPALDFLLEHRDEMFPDTPVVFCGINNFTDSYLRGKPLYTGVVENFDIRATLQIARELHPNAKKVVVSVNTNPTGIANKKLLLDTIPEFKNSLDFIIMEDPQLSAFQAALNGSAYDSIILLLGFFKDELGNPIPISITTRLLADMNIPIYSLWEFYLGLGIVGGMLTNGQYQGKIAAEIAQRILNGEKDIPIIRESPNVYMFDYKELHRFRINLSSLPQSSIIKNKPESFYYRHWLFVWSVIGIFFALVIGLTTSVIQRKRTEKALKGTEKQFRALVDTSPVAVMITDKKQHILSVNKKFIELFGYRLEEIPSVEHCWQFAFLDESRRNEIKTRWTEMVKLAIKNKSEIEPIEAEVVCKDGTIRYIEIRMSSIGERNIVVFTDLTDHKRVESELRESQRTINTLIDHLPGMAYRCLNDQDWTMIFASRGCEELTGYRQTDLIRNSKISLAQLIHPDDREYVRNQVQLALAEKMPFEIEYRIRNASGHERWVWKRGVGVFSSSGKLLFIEGLMRDITKRRELEEQLLRSQKLESIGTLAGGIAHDFNNLLQVIMGGISIALMTTPAENRLYKILTNAQKASEQARELSYRLITFSRGGEPNREILSVSEILKESVLLSLSGSNVTFDIRFPDDLWSVKVDRGQFAQVINNIVANAREAMPDGGVFEVRGENLTLGPNDNLLLQPGKYVKLSFTDHGVGIPKENLPRIFDPYFSTKEIGNRKGSGLGLSICHSIIQKHGGIITVESEVNVGTTVHICLAAGQLPADEPRAVEETHKTGKGRILLMDDEEMVGNVGAEILRLAGYEVELSGNGEQAIEQYQHAQENGNRFDAVILDLTVQGGMGGEKAVLKLREIDSEVKAIVASGYVDDPILQNYTAYGFVGAVTKPFSIQKLINLLSKTIDHPKSNH